MSAYIQNISTGKIFYSCSSQTIDNANHLATLQDMVTRRGWLLSDYVIADGTEAEIKAMIASAKTPMEVWEQDMRATDSMPRWFEDYITENSVALAPGKSKESYDAKVALRGEKP